MSKRVHIRQPRQHVLRICLDGQECHRMLLNINMEESNVNMGSVCEQQHGKKTKVGTGESTHCWMCRS